MIDIDNALNLKIGDIVTRFNKTHKQIELYLLIGVNQDQIDKIIANLDRSSRLTKLKSKDELKDILKSEITIQAYSLGSFLYSKGDFLVDRATTLNYIKLIIKNVLSKPIDKETIEDKIQISLLNSTYHNYNLFKDIDLNKDTVKAWLNKSMLLNKRTPSIEIMDCLNLLYKRILDKRGSQIDILGEFDKYTKKGLVTGEVPIQYEVGDIIYKYTPKMIKYYLYLGEKNGIKYIIKIEQIKKADLTSYFRFNSILTLVKYGFRHNMKEELQSSKQDYYKTGVNVLVKFQKEIQEELEGK